jgi:hypothetical protein
MRRGEAFLIGGCAVKVDLADADWMKWWFEGSSDPPKDKKLQRSDAASRFEKLKAEERLRELLDDDADHTVRGAAATALKRLAAVSEAKRGP